MDAMSSQHATSLIGHKVAFTGRGLSFARTQAKQIVEDQGGVYSRTVNEHTSLLVVGAIGWPLQKNGRLTKKLNHANNLKRLGVPITIEAEEEFLHRIGFDLGLYALFTLPILSRLVGIGPQQILSWKRLGFLNANEVRNGIEYYDFNQLSRLRTLAKLRGSKTNPNRLRRTYRQLHQTMRGAAKMLQMVVFVDSTLAFRNDDGDLFELNGQRLLEFDDDREAMVSPLLTSKDIRFEEAVQLEAEGAFQEAADIYRELLTEDWEDSDVHYNWGIAFLNNCDIESHSPIIEKPFCTTRCSARRGTI